MLVNCGFGKTLESPLDCKEIQSVHPKGNQSWIFIVRTDVEAVATWCEELTYLKRPWCWERLKAGREGDNRGWDGWMASPTPRAYKTRVHQVSNAIQQSYLCCPLLFLPSIFASIRVFSNESVLCIRWPKYWSFSISPSNEYSRFISFRIDWFDLLAVQGTLKSLFQHYSSKASILRHSAFFIVQLSHSYMTTGKTIALTRWTFVRKAMPLLFNLLSKLVIAFFPRSKHLLISWLQSLSAVILEPKKIKSVSVSTFPFYLPWSDGSRCHNLRLLNVEF